ncbi:leucine-rich repeat-containing protein 40-like [Neopsephotus bourkii]|uniref:leucine-rich repeat-containing protein 40-like n=1 Tax=Neopsephotus bourkii TaxID=309878 RepID=UPI002AA56AAC|nr:leucine-rich repeat-containing protein 40-like [Neopsephotus bourkii]
MDAGTSLGCASSSPNPFWRYLTAHDLKHEGKKKLKISGRELVSVPKQVSGLDKLQVLEMSPGHESCLRHQMDLLPHDISHLQHLTCLYMDSNNLKTIPAETGPLSHLQRLTLSNNSLNSLSPEMGPLQRLCSFHLPNNSLTKLPASLSQLRSLILLDVSDNRIGTIPFSIQHLENLESLLLLFNSLESLPKDICLLRNLCTLWLGNNHACSPSASFGELMNLHWGCHCYSCNFEGSPLECHLPEVCSRGSEKIRGYFLSFCTIC